MKYIYKEVQENDTRRGDIYFYRSKYYQVLCQGNNISQEMAEVIEEEKLLVADMELDIRNKIILSINK